MKTVVASTLDIFDPANYIGDCHCHKCKIGQPEKTLLVIKQICSPAYCSKDEHANSQKVIDFLEILHFLIVILILSFRLNGHVPLGHLDISCNLYDYMYLC